jgi:hypothetical protein
MKNVYISFHYTVLLIGICSNESMLLENHKISQNLGLLRKDVDHEVKYMCQMGFTL